MANEVAPFSPLMALVGLAVLLAVRVVYGDARLGGGDQVHLAMRVIGWVLVAMGLLALLEILLSPAFGILFWIVLMIALGSMLARYRRTERKALLWVLSIAAEKQMPLAPAVEAFAFEWGGPFGHRSLRLAGALRAGVQLPDALDGIRGLTPHAGRVAARVGTEAGSLGPALREAASTTSHEDPAWQAISSRLCYLLLVIYFAQVVTVFMSIRIAPPISRIAMDFNIELPWISQVTLEFMQSSRIASWLAIALVVQACLLCYLLLHFLGWLPWELPLAGRFMRALDSGLTLRSMAWLVERGKPMHTALATTARSYPKYWFRLKLGRAIGDMSNGVPWFTALEARRIIGAADAQLLASAERVGNIPWALRMAAESGERRLLYRVQYAAQLLYPLAIFAISAVVAIYALTFFLPLVAAVDKMIGMP